MFTLEDVFQLNAIVSLEKGISIMYEIEFCLSSPPNTQKNLPGEPNF